MILVDGSNKFPSSGLSLAKKSITATRATLILIAISREKMSATLTTSLDMDTGPKWSFFPSCQPLMIFIRRCPGADMAFAQLFHQAAYILSVFNIRPEVDAKGNPVFPTPEFVGEMVR